MNSEESGNVSCLI